MNIWIEVLRAVKPLRKACSRQATFVSMTLVVAAMCCLPDGMGVAGLIRSGFLKEQCYRRLLHMFNGSGINLKKLFTLWAQYVRNNFEHFKTENGSRVFVLDGSDVAKSGRKMPGVHLLHNHSEAKSLPAFFLGHSFQAISVLARAGKKVLAVPLSARMDDGWTLSNRDTKTKLDKGLQLFALIRGQFSGSAVLVADAYYCAGKAVSALKTMDAVLVTRCRTNAVAYCVPEVKAVKRRGRPELYGKKITLKKVFDDLSAFEKVKSPIYDDSDVSIHILARNLIWKSAGCLVKFIWVEHPNRGKIILLTTDLDMDPLQAVILYGLRFKIEVGFKVAKRVVGAFTYRFWQSSMTRIGRKNKGQYLHREPEKYRNIFKQKLHAYELYVQLGCIAQGILQYLSLKRPNDVWKCFRSWLRTMRPNQPPSEQVVAMALASSLPEILQVANPEDDMQKILLENCCLDRLGEQICKERECA